MSQQTRFLLVKLEAELKQLHLWSDLVPAPEALASNLPFCVDTLSLQGWLQFVFLPRMHALLDAGAQLPSNINVLPIAEEAFKHLGAGAEDVLALIAAIDHAVRAKR